MDEEIRQLEKLLDEEKYEEALRKCNELLTTGNMDSGKLLALQIVIVRAEAYLNHDDKVLGIGRNAAELASSLGSWDYYGTAERFLGECYARLKRYEEAIKCFREYLSRTQLYSRALNDIPLVWYNLGISLALNGQYDKVISPLLTALETAEAAGSERMAHGIRQAIVEQYLRLNRTDLVPRLLAKCGKYLRHHPDAHEYTKSRLYYIQLRIKLASQTHRYYRAYILAIRGIEESGVDIHQRRLFHMLLAEKALENRMFPEALKHAVAAQVCAGTVLRKDFEDEATDLIRNITRDYLDSDDPMDQYIFDMLGSREA